MAAKKYEIKALQRCEGCDRAQDCEYLKLLHKKPYDASGGFIGLQGLLHCVL